MLSFTSQINGRTAPEWTKSMNIHYVRQVVGSGVVLPCRATGIPTPHVSWMKNGHALTEEDDKVIFNCKLKLKVFK